MLVHSPGLADAVARFSGIDALQLDLGSGEVGNQVQVLGTIDGPVTINGSSGNDAVFAETIQGPTVVNLAGGNDVVRVGKDGTLAFIGEDIQVSGGPGTDRVILDAASEIPVQAVIGSLATTVLGA